MQCEFNTGAVSWGPSDGAETYVAIATGLDGHTHQCLTNTTSCTWEDLHCAEEYTVVVRAKDHNCTSLSSNTSVIHMGNYIFEKCCKNKLKSIFAITEISEKKTQLEWLKTSDAAYPFVSFRSLCAPEFGYLCEL